MNIAKNMEAIFIVAIALASATSFANASAPAHRAAAPLAAQAVNNAKMPVVVISAKRLTVAQKAQLVG